MFNALILNTWFRFCRRELEADYIGLILMASAGYDPRVAPHVHKNLEEKVEGDEARDNFLTHHPSGETRAQLLSQPKVMEESPCHI